MPSLIDMEEWLAAADRWGRVQAVMALMSPTVAACSIAGGGCHRAAGQPLRVQRWASMVLRIAPGAESPSSSIITWQLPSGRGVMFSIRPRPIPSHQ